MQIIHSKADGVTTRATTKTMIELFFCNHVEGGGFLIMKWTTCSIRQAQLFEGHVAVNERNDVSLCKQFIDERLRD